ncbi:MAG: hypothetical protein ABIS67_01150 [Candidatus Eisenbacteria bacterium]
MIGDEALGLLTRVAATLDDLGIPYLVGGSVASTLFGEPRGTRDVDLVIELTQQEIPALAAALEPGFYVSRSAMIEAVRDRRSFNAVDPESGMKVDFFVCGESPFDREEFSRRRLEPIVPGEPERVWVKTPEDSVLRKLLWYRDGQGASDQQWRDVLGLLATRAGRLDEAYLDTWAQRLALTELLERARVEAAR